MIIHGKLAPQHLEDLRRSGISDETITDASICTVPPADISKKLGFNIPEIKSMYEIPYDNEYSRFRVFYFEDSEFGKDGKKKPKYLCRKNSGNHLYLPSRVRPFLCDPSIPLYITEGEKKALKAVQEGMHCIALSGLWNWSNGNKELISDFNQIAFEGRLTYIVPDNDWLLPDKHGYEKNLRRAVYCLAERLVARKAKVFIIHLPESEGNK